MLKVDYKTAKDREEAFRKIKNYITPALFAKYNINPQIEYRQESNLILAQGKGFDLKITFSEKDLGLDLNVGFFLTPFKQVILEKIEKEVRAIV